MVNIGPRLYDREGQPIDFGRYTRLYLDKAYQRLAATRVGTVEVTTVWLGADQQVGFSGPPLIFETVVRGRDGRALASERYAREVEARAGHLIAVAAWVARTGHPAQDVPLPSSRTGRTDEDVGPDADGSLDERAPSA